jgi:hypothetical protein
LYEVGQDRLHITSVANSTYFALFMLSPPHV